MKWEENERAFVSSNPPGIATNCGSKVIKTDLGSLKFPKVHLTAIGLSLDRTGMAR